ncbi:MAG: SMC-Scp complex subunit ScpB [bacterium]|nr:SMC-Scp complex subunit ScpB [bacterium]
MTTEREIELKNIIEAMLFVSPKPLSLNELNKALADFERKEVKAALSALGDNYRGRGVQLVAVAGGYRFFSNEEYAQFVLEILPKEKEPRLSRAALETLSIIAYRQSITRVKIEEIRGISSHGVLSTLLERGLIEVKGRLDVVGRPKQYGTTRRFLSYFGLNSLKDLPPLEESITGGGVAGTDDGPDAKGSDEGKSSDETDSGGGD